MRDTLRQLIDQQCWCWGRDIVVPSGNLLLARGFLRIRANPGQSKTSGYFLLTPEYQIALWGFGVWYTMPGYPALFLSRYHTDSRIHQVDGPPFEAQNRFAFGRYLRPKGAEEWSDMTTLVSRCCAWIADYEAWIAEQQGPTYRAETLKRWDHPGTPPSAMERTWRQLAAGTSTAGYGARASAARRW